MTQEQVNRSVTIALGVYSTAKSHEISIDDWLKSQDAKRNHPDVSKRYKNFMK